MSRIVRHRLLFVSLLLSVPALAFAVLRTTDDNEKPIPVSDLPNVIQKALAGVTIDEAETNADMSVFEIDIADDRVEIELRIDASGRLLSLECEHETDDQEDDGEDDAEDDEDTVAIDSLPAAARTALVKYAGRNSITSVEREAKKGNVLFEAAWKEGDKEHEATVTEDGTLVELEESVLRDAVPERVRALSGRQFKDGTDVKFERKLIAAWEIEGTVNGRNRELLVTPTGDLIEFEDENEDDE